MDRFDEKGEQLAKLAYSEVVSCSRSCSGDPCNHVGKLSDAFAKALRKTAQEYEAKGRKYPR